MRHPIRALRALLASILIGWGAAAYGGTMVADQPGFQVLCVGRFTIELPKGAMARIDASYKNIEVSRVKEASTFDEVNRGLQTQAKELSAAKIERNPRHDAYERVAGYDPEKLHGSTQLLGYDANQSGQMASLGYHPNPASSEIQVDVHRFISGAQYVFHLKGNGADNYPRVQQQAWGAASQFIPLGESEVPKGAGFCVDGGMFLDNGQPPIRENFTAVIQLDGHPDARFTIDANAITKVNAGEPSLKHRVDGELGILRANVDGHVGVIERGDLSAAGQDGYQIGISAPYDLVPGTQVRKFFWSADGTPNDVTRPYMEVDLTIQPTDDGKSTIKDDAEAKAIWDALIRGIRVRPGSAG